LPEIIIARANHRIAYPARFQLVAAMNPCRCGLANEPGFACKRAPNDKCKAIYQSRLSGPLLDRIDLHIEVPAVSAHDLMGSGQSEASAPILQRVIKARSRQKHRFEELERGDITTNAACPPPLLERIAVLDDAGTRLMQQAADQFRLSARSYHRSLKVARTIADLDGSELIKRPHLAEALSYRHEVIDQNGLSA
jgi:magnesium chelatase family protein